MEANHEPSGTRLQKVLSRAGVASRRAAERLIEQGRVTVNGEVVTRLGSRIDPESSVVRVDGERVVLDLQVVVLALNKPRGIVTTMADEKGRPCVGDLVGNQWSGVFHVGRLDSDTEGLLLLTNDGELGNRLSHPRHAIVKTYQAVVAGAVSKEATRMLTSGIDLDDGRSACDAVRVLQRAAKRSLVEVELHSGKNRVVRRMFDAVGFPVEDLVRIRVGPVHLGDLPPGQVRLISRTELAKLYAAAGL